MPPIEHYQSSVLDPVILVLCYSYQNLEDAHSWICVTNIGIFLRILANLEKYPAVFYSSCPFFQALICLKNVVVISYTPSESIIFVCLFVFNFAQPCIMVLSYIVMEKFILFFFLCNYLKYSQQKIFHKYLLKR